MENSPAAMRRGGARHRAGSAAAPGNRNLAPLVLLPVRASRPVGRTATGTRFGDMLRRIWALIMDTVNGYIADSCLSPVSYTHLTLPTIYSV